MRKFSVFSATIFVSIILAGIYGILHDQITFSLSTEYFTKFKYSQFGFNPEEFGGDRQTVAVIGFLATWWTGIFIGIGLGLTSLVYPDHKNMTKALKVAISITLAIAIVFGFIGFLYGKLHLSKTGVAWWLPQDLKDEASFITVGSIHNFSYLGGAAGLIAGIIYLLVRKRKISSAS